MAAKTITGTLPVGLRVGVSLETEFELREASTRDIYDAEELVPMARIYGYRLALLSRTLVRIGPLKPVSLERILELDPRDVRHLSHEMEALDALGKDAPPSGGAGS